MIRDKLLLAVLMFYYFSGLLQLGLCPGDCSRKPDCLSSQGCQGVDVAPSSILVRLRGH